MSTVKSLPLRFPGTSTVMSRSPIVCVHLYGRAACSSASLARAAASSAGVGSGIRCQLAAWCELWDENEGCGALKRCGTGSWNTKSNRRSIE